MTSPMNTTERSKNRLHRTIGRVIKTDRDRVENVKVLWEGRRR